MSKNMKETESQYQLPSHPSINPLVSALREQGFEVDHRDGKDLDGTSNEYKSVYLKTSPIPIALEGRGLGRIHHYGLETPYVGVARGSPNGERLNQFLKDFEFQ